MLLKVRPDADNSLVFEVKTDTEINKIKLDQPPLIIDAQNPLDNFMYQLAMNIKYPSAAQRNGTEGTVLISFFINQDGMPEDYKIEKGIGDGCEQEALRVVKSVPKTNLLSGVLNGEKVKAKYVLPVNFNIR